MRSRRRIVLSVLALTLATTLLAAPGSSAAEPDGTEDCPQGQPNCEVYGGQQADPGEYPFMVGLLLRNVSNWQNALLCGGSLISPDTVLTAAHCMFDQQGNRFPARTFEVLIGTIDRRDTDAVRARVRRIHVHPGFVRSTAPGSLTYPNDAAILQLDREVDEAPVLTAQPADQALYALGGTGRITGWGARELQQSRRYLMEADLPLVTDADCAADWGPRFDPTTQTCAGSSGFQQPAPCSGDSGGPLLYDDGGHWLLIGLTSWGDSSCIGHPTVFAEVAAFSDFVNPYLDPDEPPGPVRNLRAQRLSNHRARVQWAAPEWDGGARLVRYRIELPDLGRVHFVPYTKRAKIVRNLPAGPVHIEVRAVNTIGPGAPSEVTVTI